MNETPGRWAPIDFSGPSKQLCRATDSSDESSQQAKRAGIGRALFDFIEAVMYKCR